MNNSLRSIHIYDYNNLWVFDDDDVGLVKEPFIAGIDRIITHYVETLDLDPTGFNAIFSTTQFPGYHAELEWSFSEGDGNWYRCVELCTSGWLCPALMHYFESPPEKLFVQFTA